MAKICSGIASHQIESIDKGLNVKRSNPADDSTTTQLPRNGRQSIFQGNYVAL